MDYVLTPDQFEELAHTFNLMDRNNDGLITWDDLVKVLESLQGRSRKEVVRDMINEVDFDGNGAIDFEEFLDFMARRMQGNEAEGLQEAFAVFDVDHDGYISPTEVIFDVDYGRFFGYCNGCCYCGAAEKGDEQHGSEDDGR